MNRLSRRDFLRMASCGLGAFAFGPWIGHLNQARGLRVLRVTSARVKIYREPDPRSEVVYTHGRDELFNAYYPLSPAAGRDPLWYRVWGGYAPSAFLQVVQMRLNQPPERLPDGGALAEVTVPFTPSLLWDQTRRGWTPNYRLYYGSTHWVTGTRPGPDGESWYRIEDHYQRAYYAAAAHLRLVSAADLAPIAPDLAPEDKYIEVDVPNQVLTAYQQGAGVLRVRVSTGVPQVEPVAPGAFSSDTPGGDHHITVKTPSRHMGDQKLSADLSTNALPGVPWVCFFKEEGYGLHGTYWHNNFGYPMSHGCVNLPNDAALWLYRWTQPHVPPGERWFSGWGTRVRVIV